jgi:hypothetical protein
MTFFSSLYPYHVVYVSSNIDDDLLAAIRVDPAVLEIQCLQMSIRLPSNEKPTPAPNREWCPEMGLILDMGCKWG